MPENSQLLRPDTLTDQLAEEIRAGLSRAPAGSSGVVLSERRLAEVHGVSRTTVRRALKRLKEDGYLTSHARRGYEVAGGAPTGAADLVALVRTRADLGGKLTEIQARTLAGLETAARECGRDVLLVGREGTDPAGLAAELRERQVVGAIVDCDDPGFARGLRDAGLAVVLVDSAAADVESVTQDNFAGAHLMTSELLKLGHRRVACVLHAPSPEAGGLHLTERLGGYMAAMTAAGCLPREEWLIDTRRVADPGEELARLAGRSKGPTAAVVLWSEVLTEVGEALSAAGAKVELAVWWGGILDARGAWRGRFPQLPVPLGVSWDVTEMGRRALARLDQVRREGDRPPARTLVPASLVPGTGAETKAKR
jgi:DNA-binding LacI/PurR family transcriptional regulator